MLSHAFQQVDTGPQVRGACLTNGKEPFRISWRSPHGQQGGRNRGQHMPAQAHPLGIDHPVPGLCHHSSLEFQLLQSSQRLQASVLAQQPLAMR
jgi:hypothetical protein